MRAPFSVTLTLSLQRVIDGWRLSFLWTAGTQQLRMIACQRCGQHTTLQCQRKRWRQGEDLAWESPSHRHIRHAKSVGPHFEFDAYLTCLARSWWFEEGVDRNSGPGSPMDHARHFPTECVPSPRWAGLWFQRVSTLFQPFWAFIFFMIFMYFSYIS